MRVLQPLKYPLAFVLFSSLFVTHSAIAETDLSAQESFLKARVKSHGKEGDHADHAAPVDKAKQFHGVFYGFLPCNDCLGIKTTLSLKNNNNYLLVIQYTRESAREIFEKGKYVWNDETKTVQLMPRKPNVPAKRYHIENENSLIQLNEDGTRMTEHAERYALHRSDTVKSREFHFH